MRILQWIPPATSLSCNQWCVGLHFARNATNCITSPSADCTKSMKHLQWHCAYVGSAECNLQKVSWSALIWIETNHIVQLRTIVRSRVACSIAFMYLIKWEQNMANEHSHATLFGVPALGFRIATCVGHRNAARQHSGNETYDECSNRFRIFVSNFLRYPNKSAERVNA